MKSKKIRNKFIIRIDKGEELVESIKKFCKENDVKLGLVSGIGATNKAEIGLFATKEKEYHAKIFEGDFEITSLLGNISMMKGETYLHLHANLGDKDHKVYGGHLNSALISGTFEGVIEILNDKIERKFNKEVGLNLYDL